jgi:hypothetical protein
MTSALIPDKNGLFFKFAGFHSFLMGLLPFYIPVLLWQQGYALWQLSFFIALTGLGFLLMLPLWKNFYWNNQWDKIIRTSFILETLLFTTVLFIEALPLTASLSLVALLNGAYLCFYWTSQRTLFTQLENEQENGTATGNNFGNFQIVVMVLLKVGILLSAFLLEQGFGIVLLTLSIIVALIGLLYLPTQVQTENIARLNANNHDISLDKPTRAVFYVDGLFLYLESYFWLLSLYLIAQQDIMQLGFLVVGLTLLLAGLFWLIKGRIDAFPANTIFQLAIIGYVISWLLRGFIGLGAETGADLTPASVEINYPIILLIAFLTSFFRLSFNKRFFDHASVIKKNPFKANQSDSNQAQMIQYLLDKSTLSQMGILIFFSALGIALFSTSTSTLLSIPMNINSQLSWIYMAVAPLVLLYSFYSQPLENTQGRPSCIR